MYWYEDEVKRLEKDGLKIGFEPETLFYGSSSIRLWTSLYNDFNSIKPVNLGFGGSTLAACVWFFERIMEPYHPKKIIIYAGDNDLGDGRHPEEVFIFFQQLVVKINERFGDLPCYFVSLKPSISRWPKMDQYKYTNNLIESEIVKRDNNWQFIDVFKKMLDAANRPKKEYYLNDGLHLSEKGYQLWKEVINNKIMTNH
jgi:lysophospholipase L1-like esterase